MNRELIQLEAWVTVAITSINLIIVSSFCLLVTATGWNKIDKVSDVAPVVLQKGTCISPIVTRAREREGERSGFNIMFFLNMKPSTNEFVCPVIN